MCIPFYMYSLFSFFFLFIFFLPLPLSPLVHPYYRNVLMISLRSLEQE